MRTWLLYPLVCAAVFAQEEPTIKVDVDIVNVLCSVRDRRGAFVTNLEKSQFTILENGKQQELRYFSKESDLPLTIGLLVDVSKSQENLIEIEKHAASQFFGKVLRNKDMAFLISFGAEAELLQDLTNSSSLLRKGLDGLRINAPAVGIHPTTIPQKIRGTILYDAVYLAAKEKLQREVGRKVIVLITDGMDYGSRLSLDAALESAQKSDAIIYSIHYVDPRAYGGMGGYSDSALKRLSEDTGGRVFRVDRRNSLDYIFEQIQDEMRSQFALGYVPNTPRDGSFRKVEIRTNQKDLKVQARKGYYATPSGSN